MIALLSAAWAAEPIELSEQMTLKLSAEGRVAYARVQNPDFGSFPTDPTGSLLFGATAQGEFTLGAHIRAQLELDSATQYGSDGGPRPLDVDRLHVQRAVVEARFGAVSFQVGRDLWKLGNGLLVDDRQGPNLRRAFDGVRVVVEKDGLGGQAFFGAEVISNPGVFDNLPSSQNLLWGTWWKRDGALDGTHHTAYYLGTTRSEVVYQAVSGSEVRHTLGTGWHGRTDAVHFDLDVLGQAGQVRPHTGGATQPAQTPVLAWGVAGQLALPLEALLRPQPFVQMGLASGDGPAASLGTFRAPFPEVRQLGAVAQLAPGNTMGANIGVRAFPHKTVLLQLVSRGLWRVRPEDAIYAIPGFPSRVSASGARFVGVGAGAMALWFPSPHLDLGMFFDAFRPGGVIRDAPPAQTSWLVSSSLTLRL